MTAALANSAVVTSVVIISAVILQMSCIAGLLGIAVLAIAMSRSKRATNVIYSATLAICVVALLSSLRWLLDGTQNASSLVLPIGLPWLGAHFRQDALASFFLIVVNLGGAAASLYGLGSGHPEEAPQRVLPFFPAFLAVMNLVVLSHVWLPRAHPAAPSHVSAVMSGVMTKVAIYGFVRVVFDLLGPPSWSASVIVLFLGSITAVMGILYAMMEKDLKRLLAYSTIENVGIIFVSLDLALAFWSNGLQLAPALAFTAALLHVLHHSCFKSLLFFGAGAVLTSTGERDMDKLGGLIHRMPFTSFVFLVGCVAISALPPFNAFVSEWLIFQAVLHSPPLPQWPLKIILPALRP